MALEQGGNVEKLTGLCRKDIYGTDHLAVRSRRQLLGVEPLPVSLTLPGYHPFAGIVRVVVLRVAYASVGIHAFGRRRYLARELIFQIRQQEVGQYERPHHLHLGEQIAFTRHLRWQDVLPSVPLPVVAKRGRVEHDQHIVDASVVALQGMQLHVEAGQRLGIAEEPHGMGAVGQVPLPFGTAVGHGAGVAHDKRVEGMWSMAVVAVDAPPHEVLIEHHRRVVDAVAVERHIGVVVEIEDHGCPERKQEHEGLDKKPQGGPTAVGQRCCCRLTIVFHQNCR